MKRKILAGVIIGVVLIFGGLTIYGNFFAKPGGVNIPDAKDATYEFSFKGSSAIFLANKYDTLGTVPGKRTYILKAPYWNLVGMSGFKEVNGNLTVSEEVFGVATIKTRNKG